jgi:hypothetical protein
VAPPVVASGVIAVEAQELQIVGIPVGFGPAVHISLSPLGQGAPMLSPIPVLVVYREEARSGFGTASTLSAVDGNYFSPDTFPVPT